MGRQKHKATQTIDVLGSTDLEEEGAVEGYHYGLLGSILRYILTILAGFLILATQTAPESLGFVFMLTMLFAFGWIISREAGFRTVPSYETLLESVFYGTTLGFIINILEQSSLILLGIVTETTTFSAIQNSSLVNSTVADPFVISVITLVFAAGAEEPFWRGGMVYLANTLDSRTGLDETTAKGIALIVQAAGFAVSHAAVYQMPEQIFALFVGGIAFGIVVFWKKDLGVAIMAHITLNLTPMWPYAIQYAFQNPLLIVALVLAAGAFIWISSFFRSSD